MTSLELLATARQVKFASVQRGRRTPRRKKRQPVWLFPFTVERRYRKELLERVDKIEKAYTDNVINQLPDLVRIRNLDLPTNARSDDYADDAQRLLEATTISLQLTDKGTKTFLAKSIGNEVDLWNNKEWQKQLRSAFGVDIFKAEPFNKATINSFVHENVSLITKMERDSVESINETVQRGLRQGQSVVNIRKDIEKRINVSRSRAKLIARDQTAKLNGQLSELRQTNLGVDKYDWLTSQDERVRTTHDQHKGKTFSWDSPPATTGHPGQDYQCRCQAIPNFTSVFEEIENG